MASKVHEAAGLAAQLAAWEVYYDIHWGRRSALDDETQPDEFKREEQRDFHYRQMKIAETKISQLRFDIERILSELLDVG